VSSIATPESIDERPMGDPWAADLELATPTLVNV